jgi:mercuric ion transport protein
MQVRPMTIKDRTLITSGAIGGLVAAVCCATPLAAILLGTVGLTAWAAKADHVLIPVLFLCLALVGFGLYRRRAGAGTDAQPTP